MVTRAISKISFVDVKELKEHEEIDSFRLDEVYDSILISESVYPIIVDLNSNVILDGHHRYNALKRLGIQTIPSYLIDYNSESIQVDSWRSDFKVTKNDVVRVGKSDNLFPPKTSKHIIEGIPSIEVSIENFKVNDK